MAKYPKAIFKEVPRFKTRMAGYFRINHHQAVSTSDSLHGFFNKSGNACSHFYVRKDGTVEQYVDTAYRAAADLEGNDVTISIETWDNGARETEWNAAMLAAIIELDRWLISTHGIPLEVAKSSKPGENKGLSWHRLGVPSRPAYQPGYLQPGGVKYSNAVGKSCPGDGRIRQIKEVIYPALRGAAVAPPPAPEKPKPVYDGGYDMRVIRRKSDGFIALVTIDTFRKMTPEAWAAFHKTTPTGQPSWTDFTDEEFDALERYFDVPKSVEIDTDAVVEAVLTRIKNAL